MSNRSKKPVFTAPKVCAHCGNLAPMRIVAEYDEVDTVCDEETKIFWKEGPCFELLKCPACNEIELRTYYFIPETPRAFKTLYPNASRIPLGLPTKIEKEYQAALKVRGISANAYGVLMGRILELVCEDRNAAGNSLFNKLSDLANKNEIPSKLVMVADKLRIFRNVGAHASLGELTDQEAPILESLARAILEYVYSAPSLAESAKNAYEALKKRQKKKNT
jgi:hypothetical protein